MPSKYDTNPLDPEFPEKARAAAAAEDEQATQVLPFESPETRKFEAVPTEEQTRRFASGFPPPYSPPLNGQHAPIDHRPQGAGDMDRSSSRKVDRVGLPENVLTAVPYIPWYLGMVAGLLVLFLVPRSEAKVRFHAAQGLAAHIGILIVTTILGIVGNITDLANAGNAIFQVVTSIMLFVFAYKAWKGKPVHIESVDSLTNWLDEKISPKQ